MSFIHLTHNTGFHGHADTDVMVNTVNIESIEPGIAAGSVVLLRSGKAYKVQENMEQIEMIINRSQQRKGEVVKIPTVSVG